MRRFYKTALISTFRNDGGFVGRLVIRHFRNDDGDETLLRNETYMTKGYRSPYEAVDAAIAIADAKGLNGML